MKSFTQRSFFVKGLFALAAVAVVGASGLVYAATDANGNQISGYGTVPEQATAAVNELNDGYQASSDDFRSDVRDLVASYKAAGVPGAANADTFNAGFEQANGQLDQRMTDARNQFLASIQQAASTAESKDQFIDRYNRAKADYFNQLDAAKNEFAARVSNLGHASNVAKDQFMNGFNSARDAYGNELEVLKNDFANTISNLPANNGSTQN